MRERLRKSRIVLWMLILFCVVGGLWAFSWFLIIRNPALPTWTERAAFGDMFGAIGGLFAGLAFAGIILTVFLQTQELRLQREAIGQTNRHLEDLAAAQKATEVFMWRLARTQALTGLTLIHTSQQLRKDVLRPFEDQLTKEIEVVNTRILELEDLSKE